MNNILLPVPQYHIAGIGAIGTLLAASACRGGGDVRLILKNEKQLQHYNSVLLRLNTNSLNFSCHPPAVSLECMDEPISFLICCTKAYDVAALLSSLAPCLNPKSIIILLHNGLGVIEELHHRFPGLRFISGVTTLGGYLEQPYTVNAFLQGKTILGATVGTFSTTERNKVSTFFHASSLEYEWAKEVMPFIWDKFAINCSINLLTALYSCTNGHLLAHREQLSCLTHEIVTVLNAYNVAITPEYLFEKVCCVLEYTAANYSSMYQDVKKRRVSEINYLNKYLISLAKQKEMLTPLNSRLVACFDEEFLGNCIV